MAKDISKLPEPPKWLSLSARTWWKKIVKECEGLHDSQLLILQSALEAYADMKEAQKIVKEDGMKVMDRFGQEKAHPLLTVIRDNRSAILQAYKTLGLDLEFPD